MQPWTFRAGVDVRQYAPAAERNAGPILAVLSRHLPAAGVVLEIGSGTGQHVIAFAAAHPELSWQPSDPDPAARASIAAWTAAAALANVRAPLDLDVTAEDWTRALARPLQGLVCINLLHIAPWAACTGLMAGAGPLLERGAPLYLYGPFKQGGQHTAPSNAEFDRYLRAFDPTWGVRDLEAVVACAADHGLDLVAVEPMPANNLSVILRRESARYFGPSSLEPAALQLQGFACIVHPLAVGKQTMTKRVFEVRAEWDERARVWIATSADVPGLCCEAPEFEELVAITLGIVPELLVANGVLSPEDASEVPVKVVAERREIARLVA